MLKTGYDIKNFRKINGLSQGQFAKLIKCKKSQIYNAECKHPSRKLPVWLNLKIEECKELNDFIALYKEEKKKFKLWEWIMNLLKK